MSEAAMSEPRPQDRQPPPTARVGPSGPRRDLESTSVLLARARDGDAAAREALAARYLPALRRFAHGRIPASARSVFDTDDLVQVSVVRALNRLGAFVPERPGSFLAYLRQIVLNRIRDELRRVSRTPELKALPEDLRDPAADPLEEELGRETLARYERALAALPADCQDAVIMRVELGSSYGEIAEALGRPSAGAARKHTLRAILKLARKLRAGPDAP